MTKEECFGESEKQEIESMLEKKQLFMRQAKRYCKKHAERKRVSRIAKMIWKIF